MICSCCQRDKTDEYLHPLANGATTEIVTAVCVDCLAAHIAKHLRIQFVFSEQDKEEIRHIVKHELMNHTGV
jgi:protein-arginine kinase activator protein McsA